MKVAFSISVTSFAEYMIQGLLEAYLVIRKSKNVECCLFLTVDQFSINSIQSQRLGDSRVQSIEARTSAHHLHF